MFDPDSTLPNPFPGEFEFLELLGEGSFGKVWLAKELNPLGRNVAVKTLHAPGSKLLTEDARASLRREAHLLAVVRHPNVVQVYAWRSAGPRDFLVLQYVPGGSLLDQLRAGPLGWSRAGRYVADVAEGLLEVHRQGIVHRDVKPANILLDTACDEALLGDFGVANWLDLARTAIGTPLYMAPEAFQGEAAESTDVYSLAATLFHLALDCCPFPAASRGELLRKIAAGLPDPDPRCAGLPAELEQVLRAGLQFQAADRPGLEEFRDRLRGVLNATLADALKTDAPPALGPWVRLRLGLVGPNGVYLPLTASPPLSDYRVRDLKKVPKQPDRVAARTGDRVRLEVEVGRAGYVMVFNVGPAGALNLLYPDPEAPAPRAERPPDLLRPGKPLHILDVELTPPAGRERVFAVWTAVPQAVRLDELRGLAEGKPGEVSRPYRASRDMVKVKQGLDSLPADGRQVAVIELDHLGR